MEFISRSTMFYPDLMAGHTLATNRPNRASVLPPNMSVSHPGTSYSHLGALSKAYSEPPAISSGVTPHQRLHRRDRGVLKLHMLLEGNVVSHPETSFLGSSPLLGMSPAFVGFHSTVQEEPLKYSTGRPHQETGRPTLAKPDLSVTESELLVSQSPSLKASSCSGRRRQHSPSLDDTKSLDQSP